MLTRAMSATSSHKHTPRHSPTLLTLSYYLQRSNHNEVSWKDNDHELLTMIDQLKGPPARCRQDDASPDEDSLWFLLPTSHTYQPETMIWYTNLPVSIFITPGSGDWILAWIRRGYISPPRCARIGCRKLEIFETSYLSRNRVSSTG